jgi:hypothetical protein
MVKEARPQTMKDVTTNHWEETLVERRVTYTIEVNGKLIVIENVPAGCLWRRVSSFSLPKRLNACNKRSGNAGNPPA